MKKILFCILTVLCILTLTAGAETPFFNFEFSHNGADGLKTGDVINCTVKYSDINDKGLSSVEFAVLHSEGLEFNRDAASTGLESGWTLWNPNVGEGSVKIAAVDDTAVTPGKKDFEITFSFTVKSENLSKESIAVSDNYAYDFDGNEIESTASKSEFFVEIPEVTLENAGASLRVNKTPALRFGVRCETLPEGVQLGVLVCETEKLNGELNHSVSAAHIMNVTNKISDGFYCTDAFEIASNTEKYTFRPFAEFKTDGGESYCLYFDSLERSASDVAQAELASDSDILRDILSSFIPKT